MIIGYYEQIFFGGGTYYKLSKKDEEKEYKIEYSHSAVLNYIPEAERYIKKYDTLRIEDERKNEYFEGKIKVDYISNNLEIESLMDNILTCNWEEISKKEYHNNDILDGLSWYFFIEVNGKNMR